MSSPHLPHQGILLLGIWWLMTAVSIQAQTRYWELEPVKDPTVELGTYTVVGGKTSENGVRFVLKNNKITAPVVVTVIAADKNKPLRLAVFREGAPFLDKDSGAEGKVVCRFRTGEDMKFKLTGASGAAYQFAVWRGPEINTPPPDPTVPMSKAIGASSPAPAGAAAPVHSSPSASAEVKSSGGMSAAIYVLLGGIFVVLVVIAILLFRGQQARSRTPLILAALLLPDTAANAQEANLDDRPSQIEPSARDLRLAEEAQKRIDQFKAVADGFKQLTHDKVDFNQPLDLSELKERGLRNPDLNVAGFLQTVLNLLEEFEIIDPREKFLQADYNPPGLPVLPSRALEDPNLTPAVYGAFIDLQRRINQAKTHLEKNYLVLKQTELKTKRLEDLADTAGGFSAIAGLYWAKSKADPNDPMNQSKETFYKTYDGGQENGLTFLNDTLKAMAEFEKEHYGDTNWYLYFGLPYYNFMVARYVRK